MDPTKGSEALRQQVKSRGQGPTWGSVKPESPGSFTARGQDVKETLLQPVEGRKGVGLPGGLRAASSQMALGLRLKSASSQTALGLRLRSASSQTALGLRLKGDSSKARAGSV